MQQAVVVRGGDRRRQARNAAVDVGAQARVRVDLVALAEEDERLLLEDAKFLRPDLVRQHAERDGAELEPARFGRARQAIELRCQCD